MSKRKHTTYEGQTHLSYYQNKQPKFTCTEPQHLLIPDSIMDGSDFSIRATERSSEDEIQDKSGCSSSNKTSDIKHDKFDESRNQAGASDGQSPAQEDVSEGEDVQQSLDDNRAKDVDQDVDNVQQEQVMNKSEVADEVLPEDIDPCDFIEKVKAVFEERNKVKEKIEAAIVNAKYVNMKMKKSNDVYSSPSGECVENQGSNNGDDEYVVVNDDSYIRAQEIVVKILQPIFDIMKVKFDMTPFQSDFTRMLETSMNEVENCMQIPTKMLVLIMKLACENGNLVTENSQLQTFSEENCKLKAKIEELEKNCRKWERDYDILRAEHSSSIQHINKLQNEKPKFEAVVDRFFKESHSKDNELRSRDEQIKTLEETLGEHKRTIETQGSKIASLKYEKSQINMAKTSQDVSLNDKERRIKDLRSQNSNLKNELDKITSTKTQLQYDYDAVKKECNEKEDTISNNNKKIDELHAENNQLNEQKKNNEKEIAAMKEELEKLKRKKPVNCGVPSALYNDHRLTGVLSQLQAQMTSDVGTLVMAPKDEDALKNEKFILIPCVNASRVGSDIEGTLAKIGSTGAAKLILLVFHHLAKHNSRIHTPTRDRIEPRQVALCAAVIDVVYWHHEMYPCDANTKAVNELKMALQMT